MESMDIQEGFWGELRYVQGKVLNTVASLLGLICLAAILTSGFWSVIIFTGPQKQPITAPAAVLEEGAEDPLTLQWLAGAAGESFSSNHPLGSARLHLASVSGFRGFETAYFYFSHAPPCQSFFRY